MLLWLLMGCTRAPIQDLWEYNGMVQIKDFFTSVVYIEEYNLLIDTGFHKQSKPVANYLAEKDLTLADIEYVLLTHPHEDHCVGLDNFPNAQVYMHENGVDALKEYGFEADVLFNETFWIEDLQIHPYEMLGHVDGNVALQIKDVLIMGDSGQSLKDGSIETVDSKFSDNPELTATELAGLYDRLEDPESVTWMIFSHSGPLVGLQALQDYAPE